jgi:hypothetical protein
MMAEGTQPTGYRPVMWQVVVAEGKEVTGSYKDNGVPPSPVRKMYEAAEAAWKIEETLKGQPSAERTNAAIKKYLSE